VCRSTQLPSLGAKVPAASVLVATALQLLQRSGGVLPCNRIAVSTNDFLPLPAGSWGAFGGSFTAGKEKVCPSIVLEALISS
jgi:hypothetical protein